MIVCTKNSDTLIRKAFGKEQVTVTSIQVICSQLPLDPSLTMPSRDAYLVTSDDIRNTRLKQQFVESLATKHPNSKIIFVDKGSKPTFTTSVAGLDKVLSRPKPNDLTMAMSEILASGTISDKLDIRENDVEIPDFINSNIPIGSTVTPDNSDEDDFTSFVNFGKSVVASTNNENEDSNSNNNDYQEELILPPIIDESEETEDYIGDSNLIKRIKNTRNVSEISILTKEITSAQIIKDIIDSNPSYAAIEEKLKGLSDSIYLIMTDSSIRTLDEKLSRIRTLLHDKAFFAAKGDTLIEQRVEEIIEVICDQTSSLLESRLSEIDTAIRIVSTAKEIDASNTRLAGLNEERVNIILELRILEAELIDIFKNSDNIAISSINRITEKSVNITGNPILDTHIQARGGSVISDDTINAIRSVMEKTNITEEEYYLMKNKVVVMLKKLSKLFDLNREEVTAYRASIEYLKAQNVENTIIAETLLKKSLRVFLGEEGNGRTVIPYLLSYFKSRQNSNVLLMDITGTGKYEEYGIIAMNPESYFTNLNQQEFLLVSGEVPNTVTMAQRLLTTLLKSADYYRVINIVMRPDQKELFNTIASDILSINYITDIVPSNLEKTRLLINNTSMENVAKKVIINKCDIPTKPILKKLDLLDRLDFQMCTIPTIPAITDASLNNYNPYGISSVAIQMEEILKYA